MVSLREITEDNRAAVEALAVTEEQSYYVASVTQSLHDAANYPDARPARCTPTTSLRNRDPSI